MEHDGVEHFKGHLPCHHSHSNSLFSSEEMKEVIEKYPKAI
jgi:hypothetical protein